MDPSKLLDPWAQLAEMQRWLPTRYEPIDPTVQEIAILATMHNMASAVQDSADIKTAIAAAIADRARRLGPEK
jgi:hypothetical protein